MNLERLKFLKITIALLALGCVGGLTIWLLITIARTFSAAEANVKAALITGTLTVSAGLITYALTRLKENEFKLRERKADAYSRYFKFCFNIQRGLKELQSHSETEMLSEMFDISEGLLTWGSDEILKEWTLFREFLILQADLEADGDQRIAHTAVMLNHMSELMWLMRRDLGHKNKDIDRSLIRRAYITITGVPADSPLLS